MDDVPLAFLDTLGRLPRGHGGGRYRGRPYGVTLTVSADERRWWLFAEELGGTDRISFNLYLLAGGRAALRPCEMPAEKVVEFVLGYRPEAEG